MVSDGGVAETAPPHFCARQIYLRNLRQSMHRQRQIKARADRRHKQSQEAGGAIIGCDADGVPLIYKSLIL